CYQYHKAFYADRRPDEKTVLVSVIRGGPANFHSRTGTTNKGIWVGDYAKCLQQPSERHWRRGRHILRISLHSHLECAKAGDTFSAQCSRSGTDISHLTAV